MVLSFFENEIKRNNNPNFFNNMTVDELRRNVKRIIKDIHGNNISDNHYQFFTNSKVINACIEESYYQMNRAVITSNSLLNTRNNISLMNITSIYCTAEVGSGMLVDLLNEYTMKSNAWWGIYEAFCRVKNMEDINMIMNILKSTIQPLQKNVMYVL